VRGTSSVSGRLASTRRSRLRPWGRLAALAALALLVLIPNATAILPCMSDNCMPADYGSSTLSVLITTPNPNATVSGIVSVTAQTSGTKAQNVAAVEFYFDNILFATVTTKPYKVDWNTLDPGQLAYDGSHFLTAVAYDAFGKARSAPVPVTVANTAGTKYQASFSTAAPLPQDMLYDPAAGTQQTVPVNLTVTNQSSLPWSAAKTKLYYRWITPDPPDAQGNPVFEDGPPIPLPLDVPAGGSAQFTVQVPPPTLATGVDRGQYRLRFDLADTTSGTVFFATKGNPPLENPIIDNKLIESQALGLERYYPYEGEEIGGGMQHLTNLASGNSLLRWSPWLLPGRGLATVVDVTYNALEKKSESPLGNNFSLSISTLNRLGLPLDIHPNNADTNCPNTTSCYIDLVDGDGTRLHFIGHTAADGTIWWEEPPGVHLYLRRYSTTDSTKRWAITRPDRVTFFYDDQGFPTGVEDKNGNRLNFTLETVQPADDPGGVKKRITYVTDAGGRSLSIDYFTQAEVKKPQMRGKIQSLSDHAGHKLVFDYYTDGNLLRITQVGGATPSGGTLANRTWVFTYTTSDGSGPAIPLASDRIDPDPTTSNESTRLYSVRDPRGTETTFSYYGPTSAQLRWKLQTRTDRLGNTTSYAYDLTNRVTTVTAPLSRVTKYAYDTEGKPTTITNPLNQQTLIAWTADRQVSKVTEPGGAHRDFTYNDNGYLTSVSDQLQHSTALAYQNVAVDGNDVSGKWKTGRTVPHVSQLTKVTAPNGTATATAGDFEWNFAYNPTGDLISATDPQNFATIYTPNADGTIASVKDADLHTTSFEYDASGQPSKVTDAKGQVTQLGYDADGLLLWLQDANHAADSGTDTRSYRSYFDYDPFHRLVRQSTPKSTQFDRGNLIWSDAAFDANDNLVSVVDSHYGATDSGSGPTTSLSYDAMDRRTLVTGPDTSADPLGERTRYAYDAAGRLTQLTLPRGVQTTAFANDFSIFYSYDDLDRVVKQTSYDLDGSGAITATRNTHYCYDLPGNLVSVTAPRAGLASISCPTTAAFTTKNAYDAAHRLLTTTDPLNHVLTVTYDNNDNVATVKDESGNTQTRSYDQRDLLTKVVDPFVVGGRTLTTKYDYDGVGNLTREVSPRGYDSSTDKVTFTNFLTKYQYDAVNQVTRIDLPISSTTPASYVHNAYDANGNLTSTSLPVTQTDPTTVPADKKTLFTFFDPGWIRTIKDTTTPAVHFDYLAQGWQSSRIPDDTSGNLDPGHSMSWTYFLDGLVKTRTDQDGHVATFAYDADGNLTTANSTVKTPSSETPIDLTASYDGFDQSVKIRQKKQSATNWTFSTYGYDLDGNVTSREDDGTETPAGALVSAGRKHALTYDGADWLQTDLDYGKQAGCTDDQRTTYDFTPTGWDKQRVVALTGTGCTDAAPNWVTKQTTNWTYFANGDLSTEQLLNNANTVLESHTLTYNDANGFYANGNRTKDVFARKNPLSTNCQTTASTCTATYTFDARDRLTHYNWKNSAGTTLRDIDYTLDPAGNITTQVASGVTTIYAYTADRLDTATVGGTLAAKYFYDNRGNLNCVTNANGSQADCPASASSPLNGNVAQAYFYDDLNRLQNVRTQKNAAPDLVTDYVYDALDRVAHEGEKHGPNPLRSTDFDYLGVSNAIANERHSDASGQPTKTKSYSIDPYGNRLSLTVTPTGGNPATYTYGFDPQGSVSLLVDTVTNQPKASYGYDPYGSEDKNLTGGDRVADPTDPNGIDPTNPYRFDGKRYDSGAADLDMGVRRFGLDTGRFLQQDFFQGSLDDLDLATDPLTKNRYALAGANPIGFVELDGHMVGKIGGAGGSVNGPAPGLGIRKPWVRCSTGGCPHVRRGSSGGGVNPMSIRRMTVGMGDNKAREEFNARYANLPYGCAFGGRGVTNAGVTCNHPVVSAPCTAYSYCRKSDPRGGIFLLSLVLTAGVATPEVAGGELLFEAGGEAVAGGGEAAAGGAAAEEGAEAGTVFSGHGGIRAADEAITKVPKGTCIHFYCGHGESISDAVGNAIETGHPPTPVESFGPGSRIPDYWLEPPTGLNVQGSPLTVSSPTRLSSLLRENMGTCHWAACRSLP
jgi:RHS repeat-associated protein